MAKLTIEIDKSTIKEIKDCYGKSDQETMRSVVEDVLDRYLHPEYLNPKLET